MSSLILQLKKLIFSTRCSMCNSFLDEKEEYICSQCEKYIEEEGAVKQIDSCYYSYLYDKRAKKFIENYKLKNQRKLGEILAKRLKREIEKIIESEEIDCVIPVPISKQRLRERGFNQVIEVLEKSKIRYVEIERVKNSKQMYKLGAEKRRENIRKIFRVGENNLKDKNILIVDDILTTGATVEEIMREINTHFKPKKILVYTFSLGAKNIERKRDVTGSLCR